MISEVSQLRHVVSFEALKLVRRRRVLSILVWTAIILAMPIIPIAMGFLNPTSPEVLYAYVLGESLFGIYLSFAVCLLSGDAVVSEFEHKFCFITFINPIKRSTLLIGKYLANLAVVASVLFLYYFTSSAIIYLLFGVFLPQAITSYFCSVMAGAAIIGVVFLVGSLMKGSSSATLTSVLLLALAFQVLSSVFQVWRIEPWFILTYATGIIREAIKPFPGRIEEITQVIPIGDGITKTTLVYHPDVLISLAVLAAYLAVSLVASVWLVKRKELG